MAEVRARVKELIPTAKFANVELDFEIVGEHTEVVELIESGQIGEALERCYDEADKMLQKKREPIIEELDGANT